MQTNAGGFSFEQLCEMTGANPNDFAVAAPMDDSENDGDSDTVIRSIGKNPNNFY